MRKRVVAPKTTAEGKPRRFPRCAPSGEDSEGFRSPDADPAFGCVEWYQYPSKQGGEALGRGRRFRD
jgi:hypothetical protein